MTLGRRRSSNIQPQGHRGYLIDKSQVPGPAAGRPLCVACESEILRPARIKRGLTICPSCENDLSPVPHGTDAGYWRGCDCSDCTTAHRDYWQRYHENYKKAKQVAS